MNIVNSINYLPCLYCIKQFSTTLCFVTAIIQYTPGNKHPIRPLQSTVTPQMLPPGVTLLDHYSPQ